MANKPRLLIVDDEAVVRDSLREWFAEDGYPVFAVASAREALEKLAQEAIDVLLVDIRMPGMDGLELQRKVRVIAPRAAVVGHRTQWAHWAMPRRQRCASAVCVWGR